MNYYKLFTPKQATAKYESKYLLMFYIGFLPFNCYKQAELRTAHEQWAMHLPRFYTIFYTATTDLIRCLGPLQNCNVWCTLLSSHEHTVYVLHNCICPAYMRASCDRPILLPKKSHYISIMQSFSKETSEVKSWQMVIRKKKRYTCRRTNFQGSTQRPSVDTLTISQKSAWEGSTVSQPATLVSFRRRLFQRHESHIIITAVGSSDKNAITYADRKAGVSLPSSYSGNVSKPLMWLYLRLTQLEWNFH